MPIKVGNIKQSKFATITTASNGLSLFTLPSQAQITNVRAFGTNFGVGTITFNARPISQVTPVAFATIDGATVATIQDGVLTGVVPFARQSEPSVISVSGIGATGGPATIEVEYA